MITNILQEFFYIVRQYVIVYVLLVSCVISFFSLKNPTICMTKLWVVQCICVGFVEYDS
jgi:hypothetical protein